MVPVDSSGMVIVSFVTVDYQLDEIIEKAVKKGNLIKDE